VINRATWSAFIEMAPEIDPSDLRLSGVIGSACGSTLPVDEGMEYGAEEDEHGDGEDEQRRAGGDPAHPAAPETLSVATGLRVSAGHICMLMEEFRRHSQLHRQTGGVHAAALADREKLLVFREDIGRHNAVDKVIGALLRQGDKYSDKLLLTSGRLSSEILHKTAACAVPIVVSRSAPTDRSVALARDRNITLIGFARGRRMNIYSGEGRILVRRDPDLTVSDPGDYISAEGEKNR
jgi:hypothetical protein